MTAGLPVRALRVALALLVVAALVVNLVRGLGLPEFKASNYFSYFTIQSNILGVLVLLVGGTLDPQSRRWQAIRGAATFCLLVTGVIYAVLLADIALGVTDPWINNVLHRLMPAAIVLDWWLLPPGRAVGRLTALRWLVLPLAFLGYTLVRGPLAGEFYPYPFMNPTRDGGYPRVAVVSVVLAIAMAGIALLLAWIGEPARRRPTRRAVRPGEGDQRVARTGG